MIKEVKDFYRKELFEHYHICDNPFSICTTRIDVTNVVNYCKIHKNFYATFGFIITMVANQIDAFKYRFEDGKFYYCDELKSNYTQMYEDNTIGYFSVPFTPNFKEYIKSFRNIQKDFLAEKKFSSKNDLSEIWLSCEPWFTFTSVIPPFNKKITIPQFIWDKYEKVNDKYYIDLMIMVHHGFADGYHIGMFLNLLEENIGSFSDC